MLEVLEVFFADFEIQSVQTHRLVHIQLNVELYWLIVAREDTSALGSVVEVLGVLIDRVFVVEKSGVFDKYLSAGSVRVTLQGFCVDGEAPLVLIGDQLSSRGLLGLVHFLGRIQVHGGVSDSGGGPIVCLDLKRRNLLDNLIEILESRF